MLISSSCLHKEISIKNFEKGKMINKSDFGIVYEVEEKSSGQLYAAKVINCNDDEDKCTQLINNEIKILLCAIHPTIIKYIGYSKTDFQGKNDVTIIMELFQNGSLENIIKNIIQGNIPNNYSNTSRQIIMTGVACGMKYLHDHGIIHKDLKAGNILLEKDFHPKISDFGISKEGYSKSGEIRYEAPELLRNDPIDSKIDVYAFGILMYEIISDSFAYPELESGQITEFDLRTKILNEKYRPKFETTINESLQKLIEECWSDESKDRPTFDEIFNKLSTKSDYMLEGVDQNEFKIYVEEININSTDNCSSKDEEIERLKKIINELTNQNEKLLKENHDLKEKNNILEIDKVEQLQKIAKMEEEIRELKKENNQLKSGNEQQKSDTIESVNQNQVDANDSINQQKNVDRSNINDEKSTSKAPVNRSQSSLTYKKPGVDENSVGAKVNLQKPEKTPGIISIPKLTLDITPGVKGAVGVTNLNLPIREKRTVQRTFSGGYISPASSLVLNKNDLPKFQSSTATENENQIQQFQSATTATTNTSEISRFQSFAATSNTSEVPRFQSFRSASSSDVNEVSKLQPFSSSSSSNTNETPKFQSFTSTTSLNTNEIPKFQSFTSAPSSNANEVPKFQSFTSTSSSNANEVPKFQSFSSTSSSNTNEVPKFQSFTSTSSSNTNEVPKFQSFTSTAATSSTCKFPKFQTFAPKAAENANEIPKFQSFASTESANGTPYNQPSETTNVKEVPKPSLSFQEVPNLGHHHLPYTRRRSSFKVENPNKNQESHNNNNSTAATPTTTTSTPQQQQQSTTENQQKAVENNDAEYEYTYEYDYEDDTDLQMQEEERKNADLIEKQMEGNVAYSIHIVILNQWKTMSKPPKFAPDKTFPCQVFPIFATILHTKILTAEIQPSLFDACLKIFSSNMKKMPATRDDLFLTVFLLILLIYTKAPKYKLDSKRCESLLKIFFHEFETNLHLILETSLDKAAFYVELFSEANFDQQKLLDGFNELFESNKSSFTFGSFINNFLITRFTELLEEKMLNRIIAKPDKFTFGNAVRWDNFLISLEKDNNIQMKIIRQAINSFIMVESITKTPSLIADVCPNISPALISFFISHLKSDENIQNLPKPAKFNKEYKLNKAPKNFENVPIKKTSLNITSISHHFSLDNWNNVSRDEPNVKYFSYFVKYIKENK